MIFHGREIYCTYLSIAGQREIVSKCLCCFPFRPTPNSRYCCSIMFIHRVLERKEFSKLKADGQEGKIQLFFAFFSDGGGAGGEWSGWAGDFADFQCAGSSTLWFFTSWTLCFLTLVCILSPWILYPRLACKRTSPSHFPGSHCP